MQVLGVRCQLSVRIRVRVSPGSKANEIVGWWGVHYCRTWQRAGLVERELTSGSSDTLALELAAYKPAHLMDFSTVVLSFPKADRPHRLVGVVGEHFEHVRLTARHQIQAPLV